MSRTWVPILVALLFMVGLSLSMPEKRVVTASNVSAQIKAGKADFDNCIIVGDLDLSTLKIIEGPVHFNDTHFQDSVNFKSINFNSTAYFFNSKFNSTADFSGSIFNSYAHFFGSKFNGTADFSGSMFNGTADFSGSMFNGNANFRSSNFNSYAYLLDSDFNSYAYFLDSKFNNIADFSSSNFNSRTNFRSTKFNNIANFSSSKFNNIADFSDSKFNNIADFSSSNFNNYAYFSSSNFNNTADFLSSNFSSTDFEDAIFQKEINFGDSKFKGNTSFLNSQFKEDALFEGTNFTRTLNLTRTKYVNLYIRWRDIRDLANDDTAYLSLMENFKKLGYLEDYDNCYFEYRKEHRSESWSGGYHGMSPEEEWIRKKFDFVLEKSYGYGMKPLYPIGWSICTIVLFGAFWGITARRRCETIVDEYDSNEHNQNNGLWDKIHCALKPFIFSTVLFLSGTKLFVDPPDVPDIQGLSKSLIKRIFTMERVLGAFFSILFFLAIGATIVRQ